MTKRNSSITFRVSEYEKKRIAGKAQSAQFTTSDFCRHAALGKEVRHIEGLNDCNYELNKIGNNINQLTVLCHQRRIDNPDLRSIHSRLCAVLESILERLDGVMTIAIVKPIKVRVGKLAGLRGVLDYIKADFKTKDGALVFGKDCFPQKAFEQMAITKKAFQKDTGRQYAHFVQSFYRYDDLTPEQALEIGQKFMARYERFKGFQVCAAVHTNGPQLHIHYVVNSVSHVDGHKRQSSKEDLKQMRSISDDLCREYGLQVYEKVFSGHRSYGEYTAKHSWKKQLAEDVARCIKASGNPADFKLLLEECGIECDIGRKSILFSVEEGYGGLQADRKCSNSKLMSYGDFSTENILQSIDFNGFVLDEAWHDFPLVSEVLGLLGAIDHPDDPGIYERTFLAQLNPEDFKGKTKLQIEQMLTERKHQELLAAQSKAIRERIAAEQAQGSMLTQSIAGLCEEFLYWLERQTQQRRQDNRFMDEREGAENDDDYEEFELY